MKKILTLLACAALAGAMTSCDDDDNIIPNPTPDPDPVPEYQIRTLTFEDSDYKGSGNILGNNDWSSLIDTPQYNGPLLYGDKAAEYSWYDEGNTELTFAGFPQTEYGTAYYNGGDAISNYVESDLSLGDTDHQLSVPANNGSKNFAVHTGYRSYPEQELPQLVFADGKARIIDHLYVAATTFFINATKNGNDFSKPATDKDWTKIIATGFDADGKACGTAEFFLLKDGKIIEGWQKWDLTSLGKVMAVEFDMTSSVVNNYGMTNPGYFAYDDVAVRFDPETK